MKNFTDVDGDRLSVYETDTPGPKRIWIACKYKNPDKNYHEECDLLFEPSDALEIGEHLISLAKRCMS